MKEYRIKLAQEALAVGAASVPFFFAADLLVSNMKLNLSPSIKTATSSFLAGVLFHMTAEYAGLNAYYGEEGAFRLKEKWRRNKAKHVSRTDRRRTRWNHPVSRLAVELAQGL